MSKLFTTRAFGWMACLLLLTLITSHLQAQVYTRRLAAGNLESLGASGLQASRQKSTFSPANLNAIRNEDEQRSRKGLPYRVGINIPADISFSQITTRRSDAHVYQYEVEAPGAIGISLIFDRLQLTENAQVFIYNPEKTILIGPITAAQNGDNYWSDALEGSKAIVEVVEPLAVAGQSQVHISEIGYYYRGGPRFGFNTAEGCHPNMVCEPSYQNEGDGVGLILTTTGGFIYTCSGAIVNNTQQDFRSYFHTAWHCYDFNGNGIVSPTESAVANNSQFRFNWQSPTCSPVTADAVYLTMSGGQMKSIWINSDFALIELNAQLPPSENTTYLGWDRSNTTHNTPFGIHHPVADVKKISFSPNNTSFVTVDQTGGDYNVGSGTTHLSVTWGAGAANRGVTEGGSSGSPLFNTARRIVGQLTGGGSYCTPLSAQDNPDQYGRVFTSWEGGGTAATRLKDYLDPINTGALTTNSVKAAVSGPASFTGLGTFGLNTGSSSIVSWAVTGGSGVVSPTSGSGNTAALTALANGSNLTITFTVNAGQSYSIQFTKTFNVNVAAPVNTPPSAPAGGIPNQTATVGTAFTYVVPAFTDPDAGQTLTYTAMGLPANGLSFVPATRTISGTPSMSGTVGVTITANDGNGGSTPASFTITINPAPVVPPTNNPPVAPVIASQTATVGVAYFQNTPAFTDPDGQIISIQAFGLPNGLSYSGAPTGIVQGTPTTAGVYSVSLVGTDIGNGTVSGGLSATAVYTITVNPATPVGGALTLLAPTYDCVTGAFTFNTSGGDGTPVSFSAVGITGPTTNPNQFVDQGLRTAADAPLITLSATQSGVTVTYVWNIRAVCPIGPVTPGSPLTLLAPTYNCTTGAFTFNTSGGDGTPITYSAIGITGPTLNPNQLVDQALRNAPDAPLITLLATQSGVTVTYIWNIRAVCPLTPVTPGNPLTLTTPTYNCATGAFTFNTSGGDGTPITFFAIGITGPTLNPNQFVDEGSRTADDVQPFLLQATQSGITTTLIWNLKAACGRARVGASEQLTALKVSVLGNPVSGETVDVDVSGAERQPLRVQLSNLQGQLVLEQHVKQAAALERVRLQLTRSAGVYLLQVSSPGQTKVVRVLKVN